jgi:hypothetical protein
VAALSKAWYVFARSNTGVVGLNPTRGMDVCVRVYSVFVLSCDYIAALRRADHSSKESYRLSKMITNVKKRPVPNKGLQSHRWMNEWMNELYPYICIRGQKWPQYLVDLVPPHLYSYIIDIT